jgi:hypothetical protein
VPPEENGMNPATLIGEQVCESPLMAEVDRSIMEDITCEQLIVKHRFSSNYNLIMS